MGMVLVFWPMNIYIYDDAEEEFLLGTEYYKISHQNGKDANIDSNPNLNEIAWAHFINDSRYKEENIGTYEGANNYKKGLYRPTEYSIMRSNRGTFNAPSREAIYKRIMKLAYGNFWTYDYEEFVKFDEQGHTDFVNAVNGIQARSNSDSESRKYKHYPPVIYDYPAVVK